MLCTYKTLLCNVRLCSLFVKLCPVTVFKLYKELITTKWIFFKPGENNLNCVRSLSKARSFQSLMRWASWDINISEGGNYSAGLDSLAEINLFLHTLGNKINGNLSVPICNIKMNRPELNLDWSVD